MPQQIIIPAKHQFTLSNYEERPLDKDEIAGPTLFSLVSQGTEFGWASGDDFPIYPGYSAVFQVDAVGENVQSVKPGDLRFAMGCHRQTQQHKVQFTLPVPKNLVAERAVLARLMGVSMSTLMTTQARAGDQVIVTGAGPVGILAAHIFTISGYKVLLVDPDEKRLAQARASGIVRTKNTMPLNDRDFAQKVALVLECSGHEQAALDGTNLVCQGGEVVLIGVPWKAHTSIGAHEVFKAAFFNFVNIKGGWEWSLPIVSKAFKWEELLECYNNTSHSIFSGFVRALNWLSEGYIKTDGLLSLQKPNNPAELYQSIAKREIIEPFIVLDWRQYTPS